MYQQQIDMERKDLGVIEGSWMSDSRRVFWSYLTLFREDCHTAHILLLLRWLEFCIVLDVEQIESECSFSLCCDFDQIEA